MEAQTETQSNVISMMPVTMPGATKAVTVKMPETKKIEQESRDIVAFAAGGVTVVTHEEYLKIGEKVQSIIRAKNQIVALFKEPKDTAYKAHQSICAAEKKLLDPLKRVEDDCNKKTKAYLLAKAEKDRKEAEERRRLAEAEAQRKSDELKKQQDDERLKIAQQFEESGFKAEAEAVLAQELPPPPPMPIYIKPVEKVETVAGQHLRTTYKFVVDNLLLIVQEVAAGRQPASILLPNQSALDKMAQALKGELRIPGGHVEANSTVVNKDTSKGKSDL